MYFGGRGSVVILHRQKHHRNDGKTYQAHIGSDGLLSLLTLLTSAQELADTAGYSKFRFGSYGEAVASFKDYGINRFLKDGSVKDHRNTIAIPRFTIGFDYKFTPKWILGAEIEFEAGGTGTAVELEGNENGEYETEIEKGGEVALEQLHITRLITPAFNIRAGHMIVPVGLTNAHHEPINFFGTIRPESRTAIMPSTWHETGIELFGTFGRKAATFDYQLMVVAGLNANGFDRDTWIASGKQGFLSLTISRRPPTSPASTGTESPVCARECHSIIAATRGLIPTNPRRMPDMAKCLFRSLTWDAQYRHRYLTLRADLTYGHIGNTRALNERNGRLPNASPTAD